MTVRRLMALVAASSLILAILVWMFRGPSALVEPAPPPPHSNGDHDIFDVVLTDLIGNPDFNPTKKPQVVFEEAIVPGGGPGILLERWVEEKKVPPDVVADLLRRNPRRTRYVVTGYRPSNPDILTRHLSDEERDILGFDKRFPQASWYVEGRLPGYSSDGHTALFVFSIGPTPHWAMGQYLLKKVKGRWEIVERLVHFGL